MAGQDDVTDARHRQHKMKTARNRVDHMLKRLNEQVRSVWHHLCPHSCGLALLDWRCPPGKSKPTFPPAQKASNEGLKRQIEALRRDKMHMAEVLQKLVSRRTAWLLTHAYKQLVAKRLRYKTSPSSCTLIVDAE